MTSSDAAATEFFETLDSDDKVDEQFFELVSGYTSLVACYVAHEESVDIDTWRPPGSKNITRERVSVETIFARLGQRFVMASRTAALLSSEADPRS